MSPPIPHAWLLLPVLVALVQSLPAPALDHAFMPLVSLREVFREHELVSSACENEVSGMLRHERGKLQTGLTFSFLLGGGVRRPGSSRATGRPLNALKKNKQNPAVATRYQKCRESSVREVLLGTLAST